MTEQKNDVRKQTSDFKERFEFRLIVGNSIICQRYFRIINFNPLSLHSEQLARTIQDCAKCIIDADLIDKSRVYTWHMAPQIFNNEEEMREWFSSPKNQKSVRFGENVYLREPNSKEYVWAGGKLIEYDKKIDDGEFTSPLSESDEVTYKLAFYDNGREIVSTCWNGLYPRYIRRNVDLSNKKGKFNEEDIPKLGFESYLLYCMSCGKSDLVSKIVKEICYVCSNSDDSFYQTTLKYGDKTYNLNMSNLYPNYSKEIREAKRYYYKNSDNTK